MNTHTNNDRPKIRPKPYKSNVGFPDSDSSLKSQTLSNSSTSEQRHCVFVRDTTGYGFKITGNAPVKVQAVRQMGSAWNAGLRANDIILKVNGENVKDKQHGDVVGLIRKQSTVNLLVISGDQIPASFISHIPARTNSTSPSISINNPYTELEKSPFVTKKPVSRPSPVSNISSPRESLNQSILSPNNLSDQSARKSTASDSSSEYSIGTSSAEAEMNSNKNHRNEPMIVKPTAFEFNSLPKKPKPTKPQIATKPTFVDMNLIPNKATIDHTNRNKLNSPPEKDFPIKSHSYNASSSKSSKLFQNSKTNTETPRNKTIPTDGVKSNNMLSNNKPNSEFEPQNVTFSTLPKQLSPNKSNYGIQKSKSISNSPYIMGRDFDNDNKDDDDSDISLSVIDMFSNAKDAISRPGLVSILLQYVNDQPSDLNIMMLYYACQFYKSFKTKKDFHTDAPRLANEIITTFILEKSPLFVSIDPEVVDEILKKLKSTDNINSIFNILSMILFKRLETIVENVRGKIQRGILMQNDLPALGNEENREVELGLLHRTLCNIYNKNAKDGDISEFILAKHIGLATLYQYFLKPSLLQTNTMRSRSIDGINTVGNQPKMLPIADIFKVTIFCSAYQQKMFSSIRKKPKSISGHSMIEAVCFQPEECSVCDNQLWGPSPQGFFCTMCLNYFHQNCRKKIKTSCSRKSRRSVASTGSKEVTDKPATSLFGRLSRKSSTSSVKNASNQSGSENTSIGNMIYNNSSLMPDDKSNMNTMEDNIGVFKAKSEDQLHRMLNNPERFGSFNDVSNYNVSFDSNAGTGYTADNGMVQIQELVQDESIDDPDMKVNESFDAGLEIQATFPNILPETDKKRLIVLLEFYHKTRYILMNLKRFLYKLVLKWPNSLFVYFKALSLDCIQPFVNLIKSLVTTIESCIEDQGFVNLEKSVYDWLSSKNDQNLKEWISLSSNLCCTNSLYVVKQLKQTTMRAVPELVHLMNVKMHKMVIIDELTQIRPLLISLPLIVKNIIKYFTKSEPQYPEQLSVWKDVSIKMDYLCEYIDRCCIPLVDWVNNGSIVKRSDKTDWPLKLRESDNVNPDIINYCSDFPRSIFHFPIFDFQMAKIFSWSRNTKDSRINYLKKGAEVLLIFYKSVIVVLQKENEHYYLKPIKSLKIFSERLYPFIETAAFIATNGGQEEDSFILNIINKNAEDASLVRVGFTRKEFVENWLDYFGSDTQNLSRSISLYKLNEISTQNFPSEFNSNISGTKLKSSESLCFSPPNSMQTPVSTPTPFGIQNHQISLLEQENPKEEDTDEQAILLPELLQGLTNAKEVINVQKESISKLLSIPEEHYEKALELITSQGPKTLSDLTLVLYSLCCPLIEHTSQLLLAGPGESLTDAMTNNVEIRQTLTSISNLLAHLDKTTNPGDQNTNPNTSEHETVLNTDNNVESITIIPLVSEAPPVEDATPSEIIEDVKEIISEVIDKSVDQIQNLPLPENQNSYKYVPEKCLISTTRDNSERASLTLTPTYFHHANPVEEIITTTRAQFILNRTTNNNL